MPCKTPRKMPRKTNDKTNGSANPRSPRTNNGPLARANGQVEDNAAGRFARGNGMENARRNSDRFSRLPSTEPSLSPLKNGVASPQDPIQGGVMPDYWIADQAKKNGMIEPFAPAQNREGVISYGLSSYGYDARVADEFKVFTNIDSAMIDPKQFSQQGFVDRRGDSCVIPPNSFALARTVEYFRIPRDVLVICLGKSTYARCGIIVNVTPLEPEWEGHVTLEFSNTTPLPARIYSNEGAAQFVFLKASGQCKVSYADRKGKYMGQKGVTVPRL